MEKVKEILLTGGKAAPGSGPAAAGTTVVLNATISAACDTG